MAVTDKELEELSNLIQANPRLAARAIEGFEKEIHQKKEDLKTAIPPATKGGAKGTYTPATAAAAPAETPQEEEILKKLDEVAKTLKLPEKNAKALSAWIKSNDVKYAGTAMTAWSNLYYSEQKKRAVLIGALSQIAIWYITGKGN